MSEFHKQSVIVTICGMPIASCDLDDFSIKSEAFRFAIKPESNVLLPLSDSLGNMVDYKLEYIGPGCDGLRCLLGKVFQEVGSGVLRVEEVLFKEEGSQVVFTISPPTIFD